MPIILPLPGENPTQICSYAKNSCDSLHLLFSRARLALDAQRSVALYEEAAAEIITELVMAANYRLLPGFDPDVPLRVAPSGKAKFTDEIAWSKCAAGRFKCAGELMLRRLPPGRVSKLPAVLASAQYWVHLLHDRHGTHSLHGAVSDVAQDSSFSLPAGYGGEQ